VKNVAGFDLARLLTGSWGTLGIITEISLRLHARPEADESIAIALDDREHGVERARLLLRRLPFIPYACEILNGALAGRLGVGTDATVLVRMGGNVDAVAAQQQAFKELGAPRVVESDVWTRLRSAEPSEAIVFRVSNLPSRIQGTWLEAAALTRACPGTLVHATAARGVVRCIVPRSDAATDALAKSFASGTAARVGERLPPLLWPHALTRDRLSRGIKTTFDPARVLNPGILGELA
jgi:glycolate oxidase FAD binding subunit